MMRHAAALRERKFRGGDFYLAVDLHGVAVDYLAVHAQRERDAEFALAGGGRADDGDDRPRCLRCVAHAEGKRRRKIINSQMTARSASAPTSCLREKRIVMPSVKFRHVDSRIVRLQNFVVGQPCARESVSADLTHADAVPPAATREGEVRDAARVFERAVYDEELFAQSERGAYATAAHVSRARRADDFEVEHAPRHAAPPDAQINERADAG